MSAVNEKEGNVRAGRKETNAELGMRSAEFNEGGIGNAECGKDRR